MTLKTKDILKILKLVKKSKKNKKRRRRNKKVIVTSQQIIPSQLQPYEINRQSTNNIQSDNIRLNNKILENKLIEYDKNKDNNPDDKLKILNDSIYDLRNNNIDLNNRLTDIRDNNINLREKMNKVKDKNKEFDYKLSGLIETGKNFVNQTNRKFDNNELKLSELQNAKYDNNNNPFDLIDDSPPTISTPIETFYSNPVEESKTNETIDTTLNESAKPKPKKVYKNIKTEDARNLVKKLESEGNNRGLTSDEKNVLKAYYKDNNMKWSNSTKYSQAVLTQLKKGIK